MKQGLQEEGQLQTTPQICHLTQGALDLLRTPVPAAIHEAVHNVMDTSCL